MRKVSANAEDDKFLTLVNLTFDFAAQVRGSGIKQPFLWEIEGADVIFEWS